MLAGEELQAIDAHLNGSGYVRKDRVIGDWRNIIEDAIGTDLLTTELALFWSVLVVVLNNQDATTSDSLDATKAELLALFESIQASRSSLRSSLQPF